MKHRVALTAVLALVQTVVCGLTGALAKEPARDRIAVRGEQIARTICSNCHVVAADQEFPPILLQKTPDFVDIANRPDTTSKSLQSFIAHTHWDEQRIPFSMPNQMLSDAEIEAVTRYILSLRKP
jgi:mono/diheme cytochrome c family protein